MLNHRWSIASLLGQWKSFASKETCSQGFTVPSGWWGTLRAGVVLAVGGLAWLWNRNIRVCGNTKRISFPKCLHDEIEDFNKFTGWELLAVQALIAASGIRLTPPRPHFPQWQQDDFLFHNLFSHCGRKNEFLRWPPCSPSPAHLTWAGFCPFLQPVDIDWALFSHLYDLACIRHWGYKNSKKCSGPQT